MTKRLKIALPLLVVAAVLLALLLVLPGLEVGADTASPAGLNIPTVFDDNMVFQRGKPINVFGYCTREGQEVKATLGDNSATATVENGRFVITLPSMPATFDLTLTVEEVGVTPESKYTYTGVCVGEVILVSGQSNAALEAYHLEDINEQAALIDNYTNLRLYTAPPSLSPTESKYGGGSWHKASGKILTESTEGASRRFSALGVVVGMRLAEEFGSDVPVAVMHAARGASKIRAWLSYDVLKTVSPSEAERLDAEREYYVENGGWSASIGSNAHTKIGTVCYNTMIAPLRDFNVGGVVWYQGEGDVAGQCYGTEGKGYYDYFSALVNSWRDHLGGDESLPFYMVQLGSYNLEDSLSVSEFKAEQYDICNELSNVYLTPVGFDDCAFTIKDAVAQLFIHPARKSPLANRMASIILEVTYGVSEDITSLPLVESVRWASSYTIVKFNAPIKLAYGTKVQGFEQSRDGKSFSSVVAEIYSDTEIRFYSASKPKAIRYGYGNPEIEVETGEIYTIKSYTTVGSKEDLVSVTFTTSSGEQVTVTPGGEIIRMKHPGNLVTDTGAVIPVFKIVL